MAEVVRYEGDTEAGTWAMAEGAVMLLLGLIALVARYPLVTALNVAFPLYLAVKGILEIISAFRGNEAYAAYRGREARPDNSRWDLAYGIISLLAAILLFARGAVGISALMILAGYFLIEGITRAVIAFMIRSELTGWVWLLGVAIVDVILGIAILVMPAVGEAAMATLIGIDILAAGASMIVVGSLERSHRIMPGATPTA